MASAKATVFVRAAPLACGIEELYLNTIDGLAARMPPRGMRMGGMGMDCTTANSKAVVHFVVRDLE